MMPRLKDALRPIPMTRVSLPEIAVRHNPFKLKKQDPDVKTQSMAAPNGKAVARIDDRNRAGMWLELRGLLENLHHDMQATHVLYLYPHRQGTGALNKASVNTIAVHLLKMSLDNRRGIYLLLKAREKRAQRDMHDGVAGS